jgi:hypothetical protein
MKLKTSNQKKLHDKFFPLDWKITEALNKFEEFWFNLESQSLAEPVTDIAIRRTTTEETSTRNLEPPKLLALLNSARLRDTARAGFVNSDKYR